MPAVAKPTRVLQQEKMDALVEKTRRAGFDPQDPEFLKRIADQIAALDPKDEEDILRWIEAVADWDDEEWTGQNEAW